MQSGMFCCACANTSASGALQELLSKEDWQHIEPDVVDCEGDFSSLSEEEHLSFCHHVIPAADAKDFLYELDCIGQTTGFHIKIVIPDRPYFGQERTKLVLFNLFAKHCSKIKRLSFSSYRFELDDIPDKGENIDYDVLFEDWEDWEILEMFSKLDWCLEQVDFNGRTLPHLETIIEDREGSCIITNKVRKLTMTANGEGDEATVNEIISCFPSLETLHVFCPNFAVFGHDFFPDFLEGGRRRHSPTIKEVRIWGNGELRRISEDPNIFLPALAEMPRLERLTMESENSEPECAEEIVSVLPNSNIREITLRGMAASDTMLDSLYSYLSQEDCKLRAFDLPLDDPKLDAVKLGKLKTLLSSDLKQVQVGGGLMQSLPFLMKVRQSRPLLAMGDSRTAMMLPLFLTAKAADKGVDQSVFYTLLREKVDIVSSALVSSKDSPDKKPPAKRARVK